MNKKIINLVIFFGLFCLSSFALAVGITSPPGVPQTFPLLLTKIAGEVGKIIASLGAVMIIIAGFLYLTSAGSPEKMQKAKTALIYAIAGIAVGLAATTIVEAVKNVVGAG